MNLFANYLHVSINPGESRMPSVALADASIDSLGLLGIRTTFSSFSREKVDEVDEVEEQPIPLWEAVNFSELLIPGLSVNMQNTREPEL